MENILLKIIQAADGDIERAEHKISYILMRLTKLQESQRIRLLQEMYQEKEFSRRFLKL